MDLISQGPECSTPAEGYEDEAIGSAELCPTYDYATCGDEFMLYMTLAEPESGYGAAYMSPGLRGPGELHLPTLPVGLPQAFKPTPPLPSVPRLAPLEIRPRPLHLDQEERFLEKEI